MLYSSRNDIIHNKEIFVILHFEIKSSSPKDKLLIIILVVILYYCIHVNILGSNCCFYIFCTFIYILLPLKQRNTLFLFITIKSNENAYLVLVKQFHLMRYYTLGQQPLILISNCSFVKLPDIGLVSFGVYNSVTDILFYYNIVMIVVVLLITKYLFLKTTIYFFY